MRRTLLFLWICLLVSGSVSAAEVSFRATAPKTVAVGQQFRLSYTVSEKAKDLRVPEINGFDVKNGPAVSSSTSVQIIGTQMETVYNETYTYILQAKEEGSFDIGPATITVGNSQYQSNSLSIKVLAADKASQAAAQSQQQQVETVNSQEIGADDIFLRAHVSRNSMYENEGFLITFKLYTRVNLQSMSNWALPDFSGFVSQQIDLSNMSWNVESYNGKNYRTGIIAQYYLYPQKTGKLTIQGGKLDTQIAVLVRRARSFFDNDVYSNVNKTIQCNPVAIDVKPLPAGKPASFSGAVGDLNVTSSISSENVKTNEGITIKLSISGTGNLKTIKNPEFVFPNDFEIYDPKVDLNTKVTQAGVSGTKSIEYLIIPQYAGDFSILPVEFSYFDPKSGTYKKHVTPEYKLHVEKGKGGEGASQQVVNYANKEDLRYIGKDLRYIKTGQTDFRTEKDFVFGSFAYWLGYLIPAILFIVFFIIYRKQAKENSNIALVRTKKANKVATKRMKVAGKLLKENNREAFYDEVLKALWGYLSDKLNIPVASLTKDNVESELSKYGAEDSLVKDIMDILGTCEFARYAPSQDSGEMDKLYDSTVQVINKMESSIKK